MSTGGESRGNDMAPHETQSRPQFGLSALFWTIAVIGVALAYLRRFDSAIVFPNAIVSVGVAWLFGAAVGWWPRRMAETIYWAVVITTAAYLSVISTRPDPMFHFTWATVGAATGACCGAIAPERLFLRMVAGCCAAAAIMTMLVLAGAPYERSFDLFCAPVVGAMVGVLIELILWVERGSSLPRYITASWLLLAVVAGNLMVLLVLA